MNRCIRLIPFATKLLLGLAAVLPSTTGMAAPRVELDLGGADVGPFSAAAAPLPGQPSILPNSVSGAAGSVKIVEDYADETEVLKGKSIVLLKDPKLEGSIAFSDVGNFEEDSGKDYKLEFDFLYNTAKTANSTCVAIEFYNKKIGGEGRQAMIIFGPNGTLSVGGKNGITGTSGPNKWSLGKAAKMRVELRYSSNDVLVFIDDTSVLDAPLDPDLDNGKGVQLFQFYNVYTGASYELAIANIHAGPIE